MGGTEPDTIDLGTGGAQSTIDLDGDGIPDEAALNCGDGILDPDEACDDGNELDGDGCFAHCLAIEPGFTCPDPGAACQPFAKCGDGLISGAETCDDNNRDGGDGCSSSCLLEPGFQCGSSATGSVCEATSCGDELVEGGEQCDAGEKNGLILGNGTGCTLACTVEPTCRNAEGQTSACTPVCGDGMIGSTEECDDGNGASGDGCSSTCEKEEGFECATAVVEDTVPCQDEPTKRCLKLPIVYRDFKSFKYDAMDFGHDDFYFMGEEQSDGTSITEMGNGLCEGLVSETLDTQGKPTKAGDGCILPSTAGGEKFFQLIKSDASFAQWYAPSDFSKETISTLSLKEQPDGTFQFSASGNHGGGQFFPLDESTAWGDEDPICTNWPYWGGGCDSPIEAHNFHFTSEVRYLFPFQGGEELTFSGDDDVWVFVNGQLAVDIGGLHQELERTITFEEGDFGMTAGNLYEVVVFQAERAPVASNYTLTLKGFSISRSLCSPVCGDGIVGAGEECDDVDNDGGYNQCQPGCLLGGYCGDGIKQESESCDDADPNKPKNCSGCRILLVK
jgi:fibro-slime domain-containing protein